MADFGRLHSSLQQSRFVADILGRLWTEAASGDVAGRLFTDSAITLLLVTLMRDARQLSMPKRPMGLSPRQLSRAIEVMEACLADDIGLEHLAGAVGLSPAHFSRAFKKATGMPPSRWLLKRRVERAQALMRDLDAALVDVAMAVGFSAQPQFTTAFRRVTGSTPGAWRDAQRGTGRYFQAVPGRSSEAQSSGEET